MAGLSLSLLLQGAVLAQNTSYNANTLGIGGSANAAFGANSLLSVSGTENVGVGLSALQQNTSGGQNVGVGVAALLSNIGGAYNVAVGYHALWGSDAYFNTAIGSEAGINFGGGSYNTAIGHRANTTVSSPALQNAGAFGYAAVVNATHRIWLGNANSQYGNIWSYGTYNTVSDGRFKTSVSETDVKGLDFIKLLRPVVYSFEAKKATEFITSGMPESVRKQYTEADFSKTTDLRQSGFIAQEVEEAAKKAGYNFSGLHTPERENASDTYGISYATFVVPLVKAVQEQQKMIEQQQQQLAEQKQMINDLMKKTGTATGISQPGSGAAGFFMDQNEPNPFTHETVIRYSIPQQISSASISVYDLSGKQIASFPIEKGSSSMSITSEKLSAGIYIYSIIADNKVMDSKKMIVAGK